MTTRKKYLPLNFGLESIKLFLISSFTLVWVHASESIGLSLFGKNETIWRGPEYILNLFLLILFTKNSFLLIDEFNIFSIPLRPKKRNPSHSFITSAGLEPCMPISPLFIIFSLDDMYGSHSIKKYFLKYSYWNQ